ncbi:MAG: glycine dehydrogenase, partial [Saprospiraceae bacterium]|nr:glycine dehydrogenase [Saprospiraceae bacterium]
MSTHTLTQFSRRHIGISQTELSEMLSAIGVSSLDQLVDETVPDAIRMKGDLRLPAAMDEQQYLTYLKTVASKNQVYRSLIGQGYFGTVTPSVILRNIFENPGWYTQYTPYQAEIAQGRLEALLNFQTMVSELTGLPIANASLLDEGTAAAEAMAMAEGIHNKKRKSSPATKFFIDDRVYPQTVDVVTTRANPLHIEIVRGDWRSFNFGEEYFGVLIQYPDASGEVHDYREFASSCENREIQVIVSADILSLALLTPPGTWGADIVVGNSQRFGVPMGFGGPHAAFFATREEYKRLIPGRIIGMSVDSKGQPALRMALQTREQHIRREKATSNICTAQALLAIMAGMYAVYHGPEGIKEIAQKIHFLTASLANSLTKMGYTIQNTSFFDTLSIQAEKDTIKNIRQESEKYKFNFFYPSDTLVSVSLDELSNEEELAIVCTIFANARGTSAAPAEMNHAYRLGNMRRNEEVLTHPVFSMYHTESKMMRYIKKLENKDLSLVHSMISLGSCTMKLNAASEMIPVSWPEFSSVHPFAPDDQTLGYQQIFNELSDYLCEITGFSACSLQPNSGAQGEYAGLLTIRAYHQDRGDIHRNIALIPSSAHGTNPASAV